MRFPGFTDEWKAKPLSDVAEFVKERINTEKIYGNYVSTENLIADFGGIQNAVSIPENTNVIQYKPNDVLVSNIRPYLRKVWLADNDGGCSADVYVFRALNIQPSFLYNSMANDKFINYVMSGAKGVKMPRGDKQQMLNYVLHIPSLQEQKKISRLIAIINARIATQNKIIEDIQSLIKGLRAYIFTELNSEVVKLGEFAKLYQPQTISTAELAENGPYLVYGANGVIGRYHSYNHEKPQICITCRGNTCGQVTLTSPFAWITSNAMVVNIEKTDNIDQSYLFHFLTFYNFNSIISGSGQPQIVRSPLEKIKVPFPDLSKQKMVSDILNSIADKLSIEQSLLTDYLRQKAYLLRCLFI